MEERIYGKQPGLVSCRDNVEYKGLFNSCVSDAFDIDNITFYTNTYICEHVNLHLEINLEKTIYYGLHYFSSHEDQQQLCSIQRNE